MERTQIESTLKEMIVESLQLEDIEPGEIDAAAPLVGEDDGGLGLDSIDFLELAVAIEKRFSVKITASEAENLQVFRTTGTLTDYVHSKLVG